MQTPIAGGRDPGRPDGSWQPGRLCGGLGEAEFEAEKGPLPALRSARGLSDAISRSKWLATRYPGLQMAKFANAAGGSDRELRLVP